MQSEKLESLWPADLGKSILFVPKNILQRQADIFNKMMRKALVADVTSTEASLPNGVPAIVHEMRIKVPALGYYSVTLVRMMHDHKIFPVSVYDAISDVSYKDLKNEESVTSALRTIFNSDAVKKTINGLIAQTA